MKNKLLLLLALLAFDAIGASGTPTSAFLHDGAGARGRTFLERGRELARSVNDYSGSTCDARFAAAVTRAAVVGDHVLIPAGTCSITNNRTVPANVTLVFQPGAVLSVAATKTLTVNSAVPFLARQIFAGSGSFVLAGNPRIYPEWFGADTTGATGSDAALQKAIDVAHASSNSTVAVGVGAFAFSTTLSVTGSNAGISFECPRSTKFQGSVRPRAVFRWTGGASSMFSISTSWVNFYDCGIENAGTAQRWLDVPAGHRMHIARVSVGANEGAATPSTVAFSQQLIRVTAPTGAGLNYTTIEDSDFDYAAPVLFDYDNQGAANTYTWLHWDKNVINANRAITVIKFANGGGKMLRITGGTLNCQPPALNVAYACTYVDTTGIGTSQLENFVFRDVEVDDGPSGITSPPTGGVTTARVLKLKNVKNGVIDNINVVGNGLATAVVDLTNSNVHVERVWFRALNGPFVTTDSTSRVFFANNTPSVTNSVGLLASSSTAGIVNVTASGGVINLLGHLGNPGGHTVFKWDTPDNGAYLVSFASPGESTPGFMTRGQLVTLLVRNTLGGAMGAISFVATIKTTGSFTVPASGKSRSITFVFDGTNLVEIGRGAADVSN